VTLKSLLDFQSAAPRQHQVEDNEVEHFRVRAKEAVLAGRGDHHVIVLRLQR
jgi:hypothetical protein